MAYPSRFSLSIAAREDLIPEVATLGIKCVELTFDPPLEGRIQSLSRALGSSGVSAASMHGPFGPSCDMGSFDEESRSIALKRHKEHLQYCSSLGVKCYVIHPGFENYGYSRGAKWDNVKKVAIFPREDGTIERLWKTNASSLAELSDFASDLGVKIALETGPPNMMTPAETIQVVRMAKGKNLGVCVDTGHINVGLTVKPSDAIKEIGSLLIALHLHDIMGTAISISRLEKGT